MHRTKQDGIYMLITSQNRREVEVTSTKSDVVHAQVYIHKENYCKLQKETFKPAGLLVSCEALLF